MHEVEHEEETLGHDEPSVNGGNEPSAFSEPSLIDLIKQDVKELSESEEVYIPIVGYEKSGLAVKYRLPESGREIDSIANKVNRQFKDRYSRNLNIAIDTMIALCEGLYVKRPVEDDDEWYELDPQLLGEPVRFDLRLAAIINTDKHVDTARSIVHLVFASNDMAIMNHAEKLARWMSNTKADLTREIWEQGLGE